MRTMEDLAHEIYGWVGDACMDCAADQAEFFIRSGYKDAFDEEATKYFRKLTKMNGRMDKYDYAGAYADELYNDPDTLRDLMGDRVYEALVTLGYTYKDQDNWKKAWDAFLDTLDTFGNGAWSKAIKLLRKQ